MGACYNNCDCNLKKNQEYNDKFVLDIFNKISLKDFSVDILIFKTEKLKITHLNCEDEVRKDFLNLFKDKKSMRINHHNLKVTFIREILHGLDIIEDFYEVLFFLFPLLSKVQGNESKEKLFILKKIFPDEKVDYRKMYSLYRKLFEFYAFRMNRFIWLEYTDKWDSDIRENMEFFCQNLFSNAKLNQRTIEFLSSFNGKEFISANEIYFLIKHYNINCPKSIREYIISGKEQYKH